MEFDCLNWSHNLSLLKFAVSLLTVTRDEQHTVVPGICTQELDARLLTLDSGRWMLESGLYTLDAGLCTLNRHTRIPGLWLRYAGLLMLDSGCWILDPRR